MYLKNKSEAKIYKTGTVDDPKLVDRLHKANVKFTKVIPKENSPLLNFFLTWIFPLLIFIVIGQWLMRKLQNKLPGGEGHYPLGKAMQKFMLKLKQV